MKRLFLVFAVSVSALFAQDAVRPVEVCGTECITLNREPAPTYLYQVMREHHDVITLRGQDGQIQALVTNGLLALPPGKNAGDVLKWLLQTMTGSTPMDMVKPVPDSGKIVGPRGKDGQIPTDKSCQCCVDFDCRICDCAPASKKDKQ